jgi:hypothetical protein
MAKTKVIIKLANEYFGKDGAEHLYMIFETYGFFTLIDVFQASLIIHRQTGGRL